MTKPVNRNPSANSRRMMNAKSLQQWFTAYRKQHQVVLREVAEATGIPISRLSEIENGRMKNPSLHYLTCFAHALGYEYLSDFIAEVERRF